MKKRLLSGILIFALFIAFSFCLLTCASKKPTRKPMVGEAAGAIAGDFAKAAGFSKEGQTSISEGVMAGVAAHVKATRAADAATPAILGDDMANVIMSRYPRYRDEALEARLNKTYNAIVINSPNPGIYNGYYVTLLDSSEINAFAVPNGRIFITRGLIACASTGDALAALIAHEAAHILKQHALTSIRGARRVNTMLSGILAGIGAAVGAEQAKEFTGVMGEPANEVVTTMVENGFSQFQEFEADAAALSLLASAGYKPEGLVELLTALKKNLQTGQGFGKTHPSPDARIANVNQHIGTYNAQHTTSSGTAPKK